MIIILFNYKKQISQNIFKIGFAVRTDRSRKEWIDLGIHTEACMTQPDTCGSKGGAISVWFKVTNCSTLGAIFSSQPDYSSTRSRISCTYTSRNT